MVLLQNIKKPLFVLSLSCLLLAPASCLAEEQHYTITETQLTTLEETFNQLRNTNSQLKKDLETSQAELTKSQEALVEQKKQTAQLQTQVTELKKSLDVAKKSLDKLGAKGNKYSVGIGSGNHGVGIIATRNETWVYADKDTVTVGIKIAF